jgi:MFS family permease
VHHHPPEVPPAGQPSRRSRAGALVRRSVLDLSPLRDSRDFRLLWIGEVISHTGRHITVVALPFQVYDLTDSPLAVGLIGLAQVGPLVAFSLIGGALADAMDRRRLLLISQLGSMVASFMLVGGALMGDPPLWLLYLAAGISSAFAALDSPTRSAAIPRLVSKDRISSAIALNQLGFQVNDVAGPALGGVIIAWLGLTTAYAIDAITFLAAIWALLLMRPMPPEHEDGPRPSVLRSVREGFAYLKGRRVLQSTFLVDINAMVFGMPRALFPVLAEEAFHVGPVGLGFLYAAPGMGAMIGALFTGWVRHVRHQGRAVLWAVVVWGLALVGFGLSTEAFVLALVFLAIAGAADVISAIFRGTILQSSVPDRLRGRLSGIHIMVVVGGPRLGDFEAGLVGQLVSPAFSVVSGGLACVAGVAVIAAAMPQFRRYHAGDPA